ncbi:MAG: hypothetical protein V4671_28875 [Armatimonadota bacterium]
MEAAEKSRQQTEQRNHFALVLTFIGFVLFGEGMITLRHAETLTPDPALSLFKFAGWFATAGWLLGHVFRWRTPVAKFVQTALLRVRSAGRLPVDGILEILLGGLFFIVLLVLGMVSLWAGTIQ